MKEATCSACGAKLVLLKRMESGRIIPSQRVTKVMALQPDLAGGDPQLVDVQNARNGDHLYISHFQTCPFPERFSRKARAAESGRRNA